MRLYPIDLHFRKFGEIHISDLIGAIGVYVIWDSRAIARPTYLGEGVILERFTKHSKRKPRPFTKPWNGYVAIITGSTREIMKLEAKAAECLLLCIAKDIDRSPRVNISRGWTTAVANFCQPKKLRLIVSGYNPLLPPAESRVLPKRKKLDAHISGHRAISVYNHNWRLRRFRAPIISEASRYPYAG